MYVGMTSFSLKPHGHGHRLAVLISGPVVTAVEILSLQCHLVMHVNLWTAVDNGHIYLLPLTLIVQPIGTLNYVNRKS